jgi:hypothetical protein
VFPNKRGGKAFNPGTLTLHTTKSLDGSGACANRPPRVPAKIRRLHDRRRRQHQSPQHLHGPSSITLDGYGHLLPGNETEAAELLDSWLSQATKASAYQAPN